MGRRFIIAALAWSVGAGLAPMTAVGCSSEAPRSGGDGGLVGVDGAVGTPGDGGAPGFDATAFVGDCGAVVTSRIAVPPPDPCDPSAPVQRFGPVTRPLRLPGAARAFWHLDRPTCSVTLLTSPTLAPIASRVLSDLPCTVEVGAGDVDGDGIDELLAQVSDHWDPVDTTRHDVRAIVLDAPSLATRWESARIASHDYAASLESGPAPNDRFTFALDADADCRLDIVEWRDEDPSDALPTRRSVLFGPTFDARTELPLGVYGTPPWPHARGTDLDGDGRADLFGGQPPGGEVLVADARSGAIRLRWPIPAGDELARVVAPDVDLDGVADLVVETHPVGVYTGVGATSALHGGDFAPLWTLPSTMVPRVGDASDLDATVGLELEGRTGWVDARTGGSLGAVAAAGTGAVGPDGIERPFVIRGQSVLIEVETDMNTYLFVRARAVRDGATCWEHSLRPWAYWVAGDFTADGSVDVLVGRYEDHQALLIDGASGRLRDVVADTRAVLRDAHATLLDAQLAGSRLVDLDDDGTPEIALGGIDADSRFSTCFFRGSDLSLIACSDLWIDGL